MLIYAPYNKDYYPNFANSTNASPHALIASSNSATILLKTAIASSLSLSALTIAALTSAK